MIHAAYTPLTDTAVMCSGRSVGFTAATHRPSFTALTKAAQQVTPIPHYIKVKNIHVFNKLLLVSKSACNISIYSEQLTHTDKMQYIYIGLDIIY